MKLLLVRHAHAGDRSSWTGDDHMRPLSPRGRDQAEGLATEFTRLGLSRVLSSPAVRCVETVEPLAAAAGVEVEIADDLMEGSDVGRVITLVESLPSDAAVCSHGDVIPDLLRLLVGRGMTMLDPLQWEKGSTWVIERDGDKFTEARYIPSPN